VTPCLHGQIISNVNCQWPQWEYCRIGMFLSCCALCAASFYIFVSFVLCVCLSNMLENSGYIFGKIWRRFREQSVNLPKIRCSHNLSNLYADQRSCKCWSYQHIGVVLYGLQTCIRGKLHDFQSTSGTI